MAVYEHKRIRIYPSHSSGGGAVDPIGLTAVVTEYGVGTTTYSLHPEGDEVQIQSDATGLFIDHVFTVEGPATVLITLYDDSGIADQKNLRIHVGPSVMALKDIRRKLIELTGRDDLITDRATWKDNGADFFIRAAQKWLDGRLGFPKESAGVVLNVPKGSGSFRVKGFRSIRAVYAAGQDGKKWALEKVSFEDIAFIEREGKPLRYAVGIGRTKGEDSDEVSRVILVSHVLDRDYQFTVFGLYESAPLLNDFDVSFWSAKHPHTLIQASAYMLERFYRNREGMQDHLMALEQDLLAIDSDEVEQQIAGVEQMKNSW